MKPLVIFGFVILFVAMVSVLFNICFPYRYGDIIIKTANKYNIEKSLIQSIIYCESRYNSKVKSSKGAIGLMQVMPATAKAFWSDGEFSEDSLYDPQKNIETGCAFLSYLFNKYEDEIIVVACYNAGETVVLSWLDDNNNLQIGNIKYKETREYVEKVMKFKKVYKLRSGLK